VILFALDKDPDLSKIKSILSSLFLIFKRVKVIQCDLEREEEDGFGSLMIHHYRKPHGPAAVSGYESSKPLLQKGKVNE
jgi:hypothetical protein